MGPLKRLGALVLLTGILLGFPALLVTTVGSPWPDGGLNELSMMSNSAVLGLVSLLGWFVWLQLLACTLWEIPAALQHVPGGASRLPIAASSQQQLMRVLVHTVLAVGVTSTAMIGAHATKADATPARPPAAHAAQHPPALAPATPSPGALRASPAADGQATQQHSDRSADKAADRADDEATDAADDSAGDSVVVTRRGDTLWGLAEKHLGDGFRWQEIAKLNQGRVMPDGRTFHNPRAIEPGWELRLPADAALAPDAAQLPGAVNASERVVKPGDTLSEIAQETTGNAEDWPALYEANRDAIGGDPDLIHPGQVLVLPGSPTHDPSDQRNDQRPGTIEPPSTHGVHGTPGTHATPDTQTPDTQSPGATTEKPEQGADDLEAPERPPMPVAPDRPAQPAPQNSDHHAVDADGKGDAMAGLTVLRTLLASAACLSVGALALVANNRRRQFRRRRIGRTIAATPAELADVEQTILETGAAAHDDVEFLDRALRHLAASCKVADQPIPQLGAAVLGEDDLTVLFTRPADADVPHGWTGTDDARAWMLPRWTVLEADLEEQPAPYPALVSIGLDQGGRTWLLDLETQGICGISGEPGQVADVVRFMVAELAVNTWSERSEVLLVDHFGAETVALNPGRLRSVQRTDALNRAAVLTEEMATSEENLEVDVLTRRRDGLLLDTTSPVVVVVSTHPDAPFVGDITHRDRSRVVVVHGDAEAPAIELTGDGMAFLPTWGISVHAFTLRPAEAQVMAALLSSTRNLEDQPMPTTTSDDGPLDKYSRADGSLREEYVEPRRVEGDDPSSMLPDSDAVYLATAATTVDDLAVVAPSVPEATRVELASLDPTLDQDIADWLDETSPRPKVRLLGPVEVTALNGGDPAAIDNLGGTISFIAYLACQDHGVTGERAAAACGWATQRTVQNRATNARFLLGTRPDGSDWLPDASTSNGARRGTSPTYELVRDSGGVLNDADLFIRLRHRAERRGDNGCEDDLVAALSLVAGAPFEAASERRFKWLFAPGQQRHDEILAGAIHDAAHVLATRAVAAGRTDLVRLACTAARNASPHSDISWLDEAAATEAESGREAAAEVVRTHVLDCFDEDLPPRSSAIVDHREWGATG